MRHATRLLTRLVYLDEQHIWYRLGLTSYEPRLRLPEGVRVARAAHADVASVAELGQDLDDAERHLASGHDLWLAREGGAALFACWTFRDSAPLLAAPRGTLALPPATVCLEDSFTAVEARGRGIAPASWCAVADTLASEHIKTIMTKVETDNAPSRRAVTKAGFVEIGLMRLVRVARRKRTTFTPVGDDPESDLAERLGAASHR